VHIVTRLGSSAYRYPRFGYTDATWPRFDLQSLQPRILTLVPSYVQSEHPSSCAYSAVPGILVTLLSISRIFSTLVQLKLGLSGSESMNLSPMRRLPSAQDSCFLSMHILSSSVPLMHSLPYKQKESRYAWHEHDLAYIPPQATTRHPQDRVILELK
jgi:hypothetical protein